MRIAWLLGAVALLTVGAALATSLLRRHGPAEARAVSAADEGLRARIEALAERQNELELAVADLRFRLEAGEEAGLLADGRQPIVTEDQLEHVVERVVERLGKRDEQATTPPVPDDARLDVDLVVRELLDPLLDGEKRAALWQRVRESGLSDAVVAELERRADAAPFDPAARTLLGEAYLNKMLTKSGPEAGQWGAKGAAAFERALELDETSWDARFALATHLYYADMGADAVQHLQVLVEQQARRVPAAKHAQAYLWLGNLLMDRGQQDAAREVWSDGLRRFPDDQALRDRLDAFR